MMLRLAGRIALCLLVLALPAAGTQAGALDCRDGICAVSQQCAGCCCAPQACFCDAPDTPQPAAASAAVVASPQRSGGDVDCVAPAPWQMAQHVELEVASADARPALAHPEKLLARLRVLQI